MTVRGFEEVLNSYKKDVREEAKKKLAGVPYNSKFSYALDTQKDLYLKVEHGVYLLTFPRVHRDRTYENKPIKYSSDHISANSLVELKQKLNTLSSLFTNGRRKRRIGNLSIYVICIEVEYEYQVVGVVDDEIVFIFSTGNKITKITREDYKINFTIDTKIFGYGKEVTYGRDVTLDLEDYSLTLPSYAGYKIVGVL